MTGIWALSMLLGGYLLVLTYHGTAWRYTYTWLCIPPTLCCWVLRFRVDFAVATMMSLATTVSFITHLYALAYMKTARKRYFVYTGCFVSAILGFFMANDLITIFISWELIGWISYLLISFWHKQEAAAKGGTKAWLINQLGSMLLLTGILMIGSELGSFDLSVLSKVSKEVLRDSRWLTMATCCLAGGALSKSAQFPWSSWLTSAMTAPIPASALIHTATMVGAGIYLLVGLSPLLGMTTRTWIAYLGSLTAFMGAYAALTQQHMKHVLAYSTISQLGYAVMAVGVGANSVGLFHFVIHAFNKACLFLCVGNIARFLNQQQGEAVAMQYIGGLRKQLPSTFFAYLIASFSLVGVPGLAGALSKEAVLTYTWDWARHRAQDGYYLSYLVPVLGFCATFLGVVYIGRQCYLVFLGTPRGRHKMTPNVRHRTPRLMQIGMFALAICSLGFWYGLPGNIENSWLLQRLGSTSLGSSPLHITSALQQGVTVASIMIMSLGFVFLIVWQVKSSATLHLSQTKIWSDGKYWDALPRAIAWVVLYLSRRTAQFETMLFTRLIRNVSLGYIMLGNAVRWLDKKLLDGVVLLVARTPQQLGKTHRITQKGNLQYSLLWMFVGVGLLFWGIYWTTKAIPYNR